MARPPSGLYVRFQVGAHTRRSKGSIRIGKWCVSVEVHPKCIRDVSEQWPSHFFARDKLEIRGASRPSGAYRTAVFSLGRFFYSFSEEGQSLDISFCASSHVSYNYPVSRNTTVI